MKSRTSFFNAGLFKSNLKRFWPLFAAYFAALLLTVPMSLNGRGNALGVLYVCRAYLETGATIINFFVGIAVAMCVFSFMYTQRSCGMIASLPVKRESVFATALLTGVLPILGINVVIFLLTGIPLLGDFDPVALKALGLALLVGCESYLFFFGFASIVAVITGNIVALPMFYFIFNFLAVGIEGALRVVFDQFVYGFSGRSSDFVTAPFSPAMWMLETNTLDYETVYGINEYGFNEMLGFKYFDLVEWRPYLIYCLVGLAFMVLALLIYRKRRMETVGDVISVPALRGVFKWGVSLCMALSFGILLSGILGAEDPVSYVLFLLIGGFIGWFGSEMLIRKSLHVFKSGWKGFAVLALVCVLFMVGTVLDVFGVGSYVPDVEDIEYVQIFTYRGYDPRLSEPETLEAVTSLNRSIIEHKNEHNNADYDEIYFLEFEYTLKSGRSFTREYPVNTRSADYESYMTIFTTDEIKDYFSTPPVEVTPDNVAYATLFMANYESGMENSFELTREQAADFFLNGYTKDVREGNVNFAEHTDYGPYDGYITMEFLMPNAYNSEYIMEYADYGTPTFYFYCPLTPNCVNSLQWVKDNLYIDFTDYLS